MGTSIWGWVECRAYPPLSAGGPSVKESVEIADDHVWQPAIALSLLGVTRDYNAFACLFGVRDLHSVWDPVAANRGLPADVSAPVRDAHDWWCGHAFGATWIDWSETLTIDWEEQAPRPLTGITRYHRLPDGTLEFRHRFDASRAFGEASGVDCRDEDPHTLARRWSVGTEWDVGHAVFRVEQYNVRRKDAVPLDGRWSHAWAAMRLLADLHGDDNVRLVVWFEE